MGNIGILIEGYPEIMREYNRTIRNLRKYSIREIIFGGESSRSWVENMNTKKKIPSQNHQIKFVENFNGGPTDQFIVGDTIFQFSLGGNGNMDQVFTVITTGAGLAQTARASFDLLWNSVKQ
jgi:hypothetical protein